MKRYLIACAVTFACMTALCTDDQRRHIRDDGDRDCNRHRDPDPKRKSSGISQGTAGEVVHQA
jgi:hypothetical protein